MNNNYKLYKLVKSVKSENTEKSEDIDWTQAHDTYNVFYRKVKGIVEIAINLHQSGISIGQGSNATIGQLPESCLPSREINIPIYLRTSSGSFPGSVRLSVYSSGVINLFNWGSALTIDYATSNIIFVAN